MKSGGEAAMEESRLIQRAGEGDASAFNALMGMHERRMYAVALRMCGNPEDAQDCLQEAMLRIYRAISGFKAQSSFSTWVYRITMNTCLDELRRRKNRPNTSLDGLYDAGWSPVDPGTTPEKSALIGDMRRQLQAFIRELPEDMRAAIVLRDIEGYSYDEIASMLDANVGTIKSRISRGREKLREKIASRPELFDRLDV
ncbi:MAG: sigma-70 family RNA polymerase sigma factor [Clostridia bacterium]|nr:sigma-70 family RNA polymerase sigma factor [Clostridia bacterium]